MTKGMDFYNEQIAYISAGDFDRLMSEHYHDDAELVTFEFVLKGKDAIKQFLAVDGPAQMGRVLSMRTLHYAESDDMIIFVAEVNSENLGYFQARDAYYLKDGKIFRCMSLVLPPEEDKKLKLGHVPDST